MKDLKLIGEDVDDTLINITYIHSFIAEHLNEQRLYLQRNPISDNASKGMALILDVVSGALRYEVGRIIEKDKEIEKLSEEITALKAQQNKKAKKKC